MSKITSGCQTIDYVLGGGFATGHVTEICGESGSGKTQLCLQICLTCQLPPRYGGLYCSAIFLHSYGNFPVKRLHQISQHTRKVYDCGQDPLQLVHVRKVRSLEELHCCICNLHQLIQASYEDCHPIRLVIVDSVASLCRGVYGNTFEDIADRNELLRKITRNLKEIALTYKATIITTNQVSDAVDSHCNNVVISSGRFVQACLGSGWARQVDTRLFLTISYEGSRKKRTLHIQFSNIVQPIKCTFTISALGVL